VKIYLCTFLKLTIFITGLSSSPSMNYLYTNEIKAMLYSFGDSKNPSLQTAQYLESVLKTQIQRFLSAANNIRICRRGKLINLEDIGFVIRKDPFKLRRLLNFIHFKEIKGKLESKLEFHSSEAEFTDIKPLCEDNVENKSDIDSNSAKIEPDIFKITNDEKKFSWMLPVQGTDTFQLNRLLEIDNLTANMSKDEYLEFAECRQSSFVYRKNKKFREFIGGWRIHDNIMDVLGYICYEMVYNIATMVLTLRDKRRGYKVKFGQSIPISTDEIDEVCWLILKENRLFF
ncbi:Histone acetyltransferase PCAF/SAGA, subunit SUPT3H/SPT3, partial [Trachipleistophora hominis]